MSARVSCATNKEIREMKKVQAMTVMACLLVAALTGTAP